MRSLSPRARKVLRHVGMTTLVGVLGIFSIVAFVGIHLIIILGFSFHFSLLGDVVFFIFGVVVLAVDIFAASKLARAFEKDEDRL